MRLIATLGLQPFYLWLLPEMICEANLFLLKDMSFYLFLNFLLSFFFFEHLLF